MCALITILYYYVILLCICIYVLYICVHIYIYIYIYIYTHIHINTYIYMYTYIYIYVHIERERDTILLYYLLFRICLYHYTIISGTFFSSASSFLAFASAVEARASASFGEAAKEGQWVLRTPLHVRTLAFLCSAWF